MKTCTCNTVHFGAMSMPLVRNPSCPVHGVKKPALVEPPPSEHMDHLAEADWADALKVGAK